MGKGQWSHFRFTLLPWTAALTQSACDTLPCPASTSLQVDAWANMLMFLPLSYFFSFSPPTINVPPPPRNYFCHDCMRWSNRRPAQRGWRGSAGFQPPQKMKTQYKVGTSVQRHEWRQGPPFDNKDCLLSLLLICIEAPRLWFVLCSDTGACNRLHVLWLMKWSVVFPCRFLCFVRVLEFSYFRGRAKWIFISACQADR